MKRLSTTKFRGSRRSKLLISSAKQSAIYGAVPLAVIVVRQLKLMCPPTKNLRAFLLMFGEFADRQRQTKHVRRSTRDLDFHLVNFRFSKALSLLGADGLKRESALSACGHDLDPGIRRDRNDLRVAIAAPGKCHRSE